MLGPGSPSRRGVVLAGGALLLTACDLDPRAEPAPAPAPTSGAPADPSVEADLQLLADARALVADVETEVAHLRRRFPSLRAPLTPLRRLHARHLAVLDEAAPPSGEASPATTPSSDSAAVALTRLLASERRLERRLAAMSIEAASGPFARVLASMSAGVAAHLAALPELP